MKHFFKCIKTHDLRSCCDFEFLQTSTPRGLRYFITVDCKPHKPQTFTMEFKGGRWNIIDAPLVPQWIHALEDQLSEAILQAA